MASEKQNAANRCNASKSTGPRSEAGRNRASRNAYGHGLTSTMVLNTAFAKELEKLARKIAGSGANDLILEGARVVAHAELDLARVRQARVALITRSLASEEFNQPQTLSSTRPAMQPFDAAARDGAGILLRSVDAAAMKMLNQPPDVLADVIRRALPELLKLDRYERRAAARRDLAVRALTSISNPQTNNL